MTAANAASCQAYVLQLIVEVPLIRLAFPQTFTIRVPNVFSIHLPFGIQVFADAYHLDTLDKILSTCAQAVGVAFFPMFFSVLMTVSWLQTMPGTLVCELEAVDVAS